MGTQSSWSCVVNRGNETMRKALCELRKPQCDSVLFLDVGRCFKSSTKESLLVHRPVGRSGKKVPLVRSMCMMECNNVLDANVMVNTCSITETKGWKRSIRVCLEQHIRNTVLNIMLRLTKPLMAGNAKPYNMMGKYGRVGSLMLYGSGWGKGEDGRTQGWGARERRRKKR